MQRRRDALSTVETQRRKKRRLKQRRRPPVHLQGGAPAHSRNKKSLLFAPLHRLETFEVLIKLLMLFIFSFNLSAGRASVCVCVCLEVFFPLHG